MLATSLIKSIACGILLLVSPVLGFSVTFYQDPNFQTDLGEVVAGAFNRCYDIASCPYQDNSQSLKIDVGGADVTTCFYDNNDCTGFAKCWHKDQDSPTDLNIDGLAKTISGFAFVHPCDNCGDTALFNGGGQPEQFHIDC
ncbi:hypothetical protein HDU89_004731 [Geranomyces variabilis]|nr:hypothetical protein HDU89_004731 [Geranomyces variabilis]